MCASAQLLRVLGCVVLALACVCSMGCVNSLKNTIPAQCLSPELLDPSRDDLTPINFTLLGQKPPLAHVIGPDDILGIYIYGVFGHGQGIEPDGWWLASFYF